MADNETQAPVIDATAEATEKRLAQLEADKAELTERVAKLEGIVAKALAAPKGGGKVAAADAGALSRLGHAVYALQDRVTPMEKDEALRDL